MTDIESDAEIIRAIAAGDGRSFEVLMRRFDRLLSRTARRIVKNDLDAEDVVQAYLLAYRQAATFRGEAKLSTGLVRIVINEALEERSVAETATVLGIPESTVRTRFFRARLQLNTAIPLCRKA